MRTGLNVTMMWAMVIFCPAAVAAQDYGKKVSGAWKQILKLDDRDGEYRWSGYPVDNFGLATFYDPPARRQWTDSDRICATWTCLGVAPTAIPPYVPNPTDPMVDPRLSLNGYADVGAGGSITLSNQQSRDIGIKLLLPGLAQMLNLGGGIDWRRGTTMQVSIQRIYKRSADRDQLTKFIAGNTNNNQLLKTAFTNGRLSWVAADILATGVQLTIKVNNATNANANAALTKAVDFAAKDSSLGFTWKSGAVGEYTLVINQPVVLAVQTRTQPAAQTLTAAAQDEDDDEIVEAAVPPVRFVNGRPAESTIR